MNQTLVRRLTLAVLALAFGIYLLSQVRYEAILPGGDPTPEGDTVSREEFQKLLDKRVRRHNNRRTDADIPPDTASTDSHSEHTPPSRIPQSIRDQYDTEVMALLRELNVVFKQPESSDTDFVLTSLNGDSLALSDLAGRWRIVNFWATWCAPCREEMPAFNRLQKKFEDKPAAVLGVNIQENRPTVKEFADNLSLDFSILLDRSGAVSAKYGTFSLPETWLITPTGEVLGVVRGPREWDGRTSVRLFERLLERKP